MALRLLPTGIAVVNGGVDGLLRQNDLNNARVEIHKQYSTYYEGAGFLGGLLAALFGAHPDLADPFLYSSASLLASKAGQWTVFKTEAAATQTATPTYGGGAAYAAMGRQGARQIQYGGRREATAGIL